MFKCVVCFPVEDPRPGGEDVRWWWLVVVVSRTGQRGSRGGVLIE